MFARMWGIRSINPRSGERGYHKECNQPRSYLRGWFFIRTPSRPMSHGSDGRETHPTPL